MFRSGVLCAVLALPLTQIWASPAVAGAWPRGKGNVFLSFHAQKDPADWRGLPTLSGYLEYGLSDIWTLGGKLEYDLTRQAVSDGEVFARWHGAGGATWQKAVSVTVAGLATGAPRIVPAFHLGRGLETPFGNGWTDMTFKADLPLEKGERALGLVAQLGVKPRERWMAMLTLDVFASEADVYTKLIPALAWQIKPGRHLNMEWSETVTPVRESKLSLGLWMEF